MNEHCDLLVIGGGPAGAATAAMAASAGARTMVVERANYPRDKVCGEFVSAEGVDVLRRLGVLDALIRAGGAWMDACRITDRRGGRLDVPLPRLAQVGNRALGITRARMDSILLERAGNLGAEIAQRTEAVEPAFEEDRVIGFRCRKVGSGASGSVIRAKLVVAADGRRSVLARRLHPELCDPPRSGPGAWFGLKTHLELAPRRLGGRVELHLFDGGYVGLGAVEGGRINLCLMVTVGALRACGGRPERLLTERVMGNPAVGNLIGTAPSTSNWKSVGPLRFGVREPAACGALFVGDAAGTIDPFSGEGMSNALSAAEMAQPYVAEAIARGSLQPEAENRYRQAWHGAFAPVTRRVRLLGSVLQRPGPARAALSLLRLAPARLAPRIVAATRTAGSR